jgi:hypothetical protein
MYERRVDKNNDSVINIEGNVSVEISHFFQKLEVLSVDS